MSRNLFLVFGFLILVCGFFVSATDIAYVVKDLGGAEPNVIAGINEMGYSYKLIDDSKILSTDWDDYKMILVWDGLLSDAESLPISEKNSFVANTYYVKDWGIADYAGSQISTGYVSGKVVADNMISDGLIYLDTFNIYSKTNVVLYYLPYVKKRAPSLKSVIAMDNSKLYPIVGMIYPDGKLYSGNISGGRIVFFGATESDYWSDETSGVFKNALHWVMTGEDGDGDGFYYDNDCDDADSYKWRILSGYIDEDEDGFGSGSLVEVCSGDFLSDGYADINGDCDDADASYNPDSNDVYKNCVNDAPIVPESVEFVFNESDVVVIDVGAVDPEGDNLSYEINDERFVFEDGVFKWQTGSDDRGDYVFYVRVSDGEFEVLSRIKVKVLNQVPIWSEIPEVAWNEDENFSFDLNPYVFDRDGDDLIFFVNSTSVDKSIRVDSIGKGVVNFSVDRNWNGEDWVVFGVWDGSSVSVSGNVTLRVLPVNDAPEFSGKIGNFSWKEGGGIKNALNLNGYFFDIDLDKLEFFVEGNDFVNVEINGSVVSFSSDDDLFGNESVIFSASDGFEVVYSNVVGLNVEDVNEVPEFGEIGCDRVVDEDMRYYCELSASDFENDSLRFSVVDEKNMHCDFDGNNLSYVSKKNYFGNGSCLIRVSDGYGRSDYLIEFEILPVNDAPKIVKYFPEGDVKIMENSDEVFEIGVSDVDGDGVDYLWSVDGENVSEERSYLFNRGKGVYSVGVVVSDEEFFDSQSWNVFVGDISDFSCEEVGGFEFGEIEICLGEILGVSDGGCCSIEPIERPPKFSNVKRCSDEGLNLSSSLEVEIRSPDKNEGFEIGDEVDAEIRIRNGLGEDLDFDVEVSLYDISSDESVDEDRDNVDVDNKDKEDLDFLLKFPKDADDENDYAVFVRVVDEDEKFCNEDFVKISLKRKEDDIRIESLRIVGDDFVCGDFVSVEGKVKNFGSESQDDVVFSLGNSELGIFEESEEFELDEFGDSDDDAKKVFLFRIPDDADAGVYKLEGVVSYSGEEVSKSVELNLGECRKTDVSNSVVEPKSLNVVSNSAVEENGNLGFVILIGVLILLAVVLVGFFWV